MHRRDALYPFFSFALSLTLSACSGGSSSPNANGAIDSGTTTTTPPATDSGTSLPDTADGNVVPGDDDLTVQEWGTYTSVQASDGHALGGLHHEDEKLPSFVQRRNWTDRTNYYFETLPEEPLQQLETPVLYFWSKKAQSVSVRVDFPEGVVGQWYPDATTFAPALGSCTSMGPGSMTWNVTVDPSISTSTFPAVDPTEIWAPSRHVNSTPVKFASTTGGAEETEQFIFYRGLVKFDPPVRVTESADGTMHVSNASSDDLQAAFVLRVTDAGGTIVPLGAIHAGETRDRVVPSSVQPIDDYVASAKSALHDALVASGLVDDVAQAMVDTWTRSWFKNVGLRVLYLAPRKWTDAWLPTTIAPAPKSLVRTLVGRIETLTPSEEDAVTTQIAANAASGTPIDLASLGRFAEPRLRRALETIADPTQKSYAQTQIDAAHALP